MKKSFNVYRCKLVKESEVNYLGKIEKPCDVVSAAMKLGYCDFSEELFGMFDLDNKGEIIGYHEISHGDLSSAQVHPREVYKRALVNNTASLIFVHNHPSGNPEPSCEDVEVTKRLSEAGDLLGVRVLDHIILGHDGDYVSMKSESLF